MLFGIAAIWIAVFHSTLDFDFSAYGIIPKIIGLGLMELKSLGKGGVEIFLFLSGMGLYFSYSKRPGKKEFYRKRALRLLLPSLIVSSVFFIFEAEGIVEYLYSVFFLDIFINGKKWFWYVTFILIMYALYPFIFSLFEKYGFKAFIITVGISVGFNTLVELLGNSLYMQYEIMLTRVPVFLAGCYAAPFIKTGREVSAKILYALAVVMLAALGLLILYDTGKIKGGITADKYVLSFFFLPFIIIVSVLKERFGLKILTRIFSWFGMYSLEMYLMFEKFSVKLKNIIPAIGPCGIVYTLIIFVITMLFSVALGKLCTSAVKLINRKADRSKEVI